MTFSELAPATSVILAQRGYRRADDLDGWVWDGGRCLVQFLDASESRYYPYSLLRQRYKIASDGRRVPIPQTNNLPIGASSTPEAVAAAIIDCLEYTY